MKKLVEKLEKTAALTKPTTEAEIAQAEQDLHISFSTEYKNYLKSFGVISFESTETYGLGIKTTSYLSLYKALPEMRKENGFPLSAVPLSEIGDGHFYLYDNDTKSVLVWASPNGGIMEERKTANLEDFLISLFFDE